MTKKTDLFDSHKFITPGSISLLEFEKICTTTDLLIHVFPLLVSHPVMLEV